ncbi:MAG: hypothetical protein LBV34_18230, partial [Nocardiopsaceae bacterium]|nr:hypothetical protein [Nocardiopsaceae bacterium]
LSAMRSDFYAWPSALSSARWIPVWSYSAGVSWEIPRSPGRSLTPFGLLTAVPEFCLHGSAI